MEFTIFYSWQSDSPPEVNRTFIEKALRAAVKSIRDEGAMADLPVVDLGMERVAGSPEVATIMFRKIGRSAVFLGDVSLVTEVKQLIPNKERKLSANPNVLIEMGYAAAYLEWERVICVMNEHYGKAEEQPVDVRNRRFPIDYVLNPETLDEAEKIKKQLARDIKRAIETVESCELESADDAIRTMNSYCLKLLEQFGNSEKINPANHKIRADVIDNLFWEEAIMHLLRINVLQCAHSPDNPREYSYYWTHLGKRVRKKLGLRQ
jgi:hypothetical protein